MLAKGSGLNFIITLKRVKMLDFDLSFYAESNQLPNYSHQKSFQRLYLTLYSLKSKKDTIASEGNNGLNRMLL